MSSKNAKDKTETIIRNSDYAIIAIHGGGIEFYTDVIAKTIAGREHSVFTYKGKNMREYHITSTKFRDPELDKVLYSSDKVISIHGEHAEDSKFVMVGGLDEALASAIVQKLSDSNFEVRESNLGMAGKSPNNVANRGKSGKGVQLEISRALRNDMASDTQLLSEFANCIRLAIKMDTM